MTPLEYAKQLGRTAKKHKVPMRLLEKAVEAARVEIEVEKLLEPHWGVMASDDPVDAGKLFADIEARILHHIAMPKHLALGSHIEAQIGTQFSVLRVPLPDSWRVLKTRRDSDSHPPPLPGGGLPVCTGPNFEKEKRKSDFSNFSSSRFFSIASTLRGQSGTLASNDAVQSYFPVMNYNAQIAFKRG